MQVSVHHTAVTIDIVRTPHYSELTGTQTRSGPGRRANAKPGPDQDGALAMNDLSSPATTAPPAQPDQEGELQRRFGERWQIEQPALGIWSATHRSEDGRHIRCIVERTAAQLIGKLEAAETVEP